MSRKKEQCPYCLRKVTHLLTNGWDSYCDNCQCPCCNVEAKQEAGLCGDCLEDKKLDGKNRV